MKIPTWLIAACFSILVALETFQLAQLREVELQVCKISTELEMHIRDNAGTEGHATTKKIAPVAKPEALVAK